MNLNRPVINYNNIALFKGDAPAHLELSNSGNGVKFVKNVQGLSFEFNVDRNIKTSLGTKNILESRENLAPEVSLNITCLEDFGHLFSGFFNTSDGSIRVTDLNKDCNFYALLSDNREDNAVEFFNTNNDGTGHDSRILKGKQVIGFGNAFLNGISMRQSVGGILTSQYDYVCNNINAETIKNSGSGHFDQMDTVYENDFENLSVGRLNLTHTYNENAGIKNSSTNDLDLDQYPVFPRGFAGGNDSVIDSKTGSPAAALTSGMGLSGANFTGNKEIVLHDNGNLYALSFTGFPGDGMYLVSGQYATTGAFHTADFYQVSGGTGRPALFVGRRFASSEVKTFSGGSFTDAEAAANGVPMTDFLRTGSNGVDAEGKAETIQLRRTQLVGAFYTGWETGDSNGNSVPFSGSGFLSKDDVLLVARSTKQALTNSTLVYNSRTIPSQIGSGSVILGNILIKRINSPVVKAPSINATGQNFAGGTAFLQRRPGYGQRQDIHCHLDNMPFAGYDRDSIDDDEIGGNKLDLITARKTKVCIKRSIKAGNQGYALGLGENIENGIENGYVFSTDSIQSFDLNLPIPRKTSYKLGAHYPVSRKTIYPLVGSLNLTSLLSDFDDSERYPDLVFQSAFLDEAGPGGSYDNTVSNSTIKAPLFDAATGYFRSSPFSVHEASFSTGLVNGENAFFLAFNPTTDNESSRLNEEFFITYREDRRKNTKYFISGSCRLPEPGISGNALVGIETIDPDVNFYTNSTDYQSFGLYLDPPQVTGATGSYPLFKLKIINATGLHADGEFKFNVGPITGYFGGLRVYESKEGDNSLKRQLDQNVKHDIYFEFEGDQKFIKNPGDSDDGSLEEPRRIHKFGITGANLKSQSVTNPIQGNSSLNMSFDFDMDNFESPGSSYQSGEFVLKFLASNHNTGIMRIGNTLDYRDKAPVNSLTGTGAFTHTGFSEEQGFPSGEEYYLNHAERLLDTSSLVSSSPYSNYHGLISGKATNTGNVPAGLISFYDAGVYKYANSARAVKVFYSPYDTGDIILKTDVTSFNADIDFNTGTMYSGIHPRGAIEILDPNKLEDMGTVANSVSNPFDAANSSALKTLVYKINRKVILENGYQSGHITLSTSIVQGAESIHQSYDPD